MTVCREIGKEMESGSKLSLVIHSAVIWKQETQNYSIEE